MLFIDFIILQHLVGKLSLLGLNTSLCNWILDFHLQSPCYTTSIYLASEGSNGAERYQPFL